MSVIEFRPSPGGMAAFGPPAPVSAEETRLLNQYDRSDTLHMSIEGGKMFYQGRLRDFQLSDGPVAAAEFENGATFEAVVDKYGSAVKDLAYKFIPNKCPPFTFLSEKNIVVPLFHERVTDDTDTTWGFKGLINAQSAFPEAYASPGAGEAASGSLFHILIIPSDVEPPMQENKPLRIYNAVTLTQDHVPMLRAMRIEAIKYVESQITMARANNGTCELMNRAITEQHNKLVPPAPKPSLLKEGTAITEWDEYLMSKWRDWLATGETIKLGFFFHVHPDHTVGHLHMHCFALNEALRTNKVHDTKCVPVDSIIDVLAQD